MNTPKLEHIDISYAYMCGRLLGATSELRKDDPESVEYVLERVKLIQAEIDASKENNRLYWIQMETT